MSESTEEAAAAANTPAALDPNELRLAANGRFQSNALNEALPLYSMAVEVSRQRGDGDPDLVIHLCNRAACLYKMEMFEEARDDAEEAVKMSDGANCKAYFRLARSHTIASDQFNRSTLYKADHIINNQIWPMQDAAAPT